jgi:hypothetical protein
MPQRRRVLPIIFVPTRESPRDRRPAATRTKKREAAEPPLRIIFDASVYLSSTSSPTSISRYESVIRPMAQRSPTSSTDISPR